MTIEIINPSTGKLYKQFDTMSWDSVSDRVAKNVESYHQWKQTRYSERAQYLEKAASLLLDRKNEYAEIITNEMGKPIAQAIKEIEKCALVCRHYAEHAEEYLQGRSITTELTKSYVSYHSIGTVFAIMPWNFPFWQVFRFAAPTLMAGNTVLLKHAPNSTATAVAIEALLSDAGFPRHVFCSLIIDTDMAAKVIQHPDIKAVTLTGSERAGSVVGATAAAAIKKVVLELGGCDPYIILEDADLDLAVEACIASRLNNAGQVCISAKRIIVVDAVKDAVISKIHKMMENYQPGDPLDPDCMLGPIARTDLRIKVERQVQESIDKGAVCLIGGHISPGPGFYYPATLLTDIKPGMPAYSEEIFGPVVSVINVKDEQAAIKVANDTAFGLSAGVFTADVSRGEVIARDHLVAGVCCVNMFASSDPRLPFGGTKLSGYGRELSAEGIREFCNLKTVCIK